MRLGLVMLLCLGSGCATVMVIPGTKVVDTKENRQIIQTVEAYRMAMERKDAVALLAMASPDYFEDSATPSAEDDYGYEGLKRVLVTRLAQIERLRYSMQYMNIDVKERVTFLNGRELKEKIAFVDAFIDGSFQVHTPQGDRWERKQDPHRFELVFDGKRWLFRRGM